MEMPDHLPPPAELDSRERDEHSCSISLAIGVPIIVFAWLALVYSLLAR